MPNLSLRHQAAIAVTAAADGQRHQPAPRGCSRGRSHRTEFDPPLPKDGPKELPSAPITAGWDTSTAAWMARLPRDPAALRANLYAHTPGD